jgi:hypothetical protein
LVIGVPILTPGILLGFVLGAIPVEDPAGGVEMFPSGRGDIFGVGLVLGPVPELEGGVTLGAVPVEGVVPIPGVTLGI